MVAEAAVHDSVRDLFKDLVPPEVIEAYDQLRASNGCAKDQAEEFVGGADLVAALTSRGMAHVLPHTPHDPAWLRPASPDIALQGVLAGYQHQLAREQELLLDGSRRLADAQARFGSGMNGRFPAHLVSVVSDRDEISELSASLVNTARKDWMTLENLATDMPLTEDFAQPPLPSSAGLVRCRSIYSAAAADDPVAWQIIQASADGGEQARLLPEVPMKMKLADQTTAHASPHPERHRWGAADPGAGDHQRAARVLRAALGACHACHLRSAGSTRGPAATGPAGGAGNDGHRGQRRCHRAAAGHQRHDGPPAHRGDHGAARRF